MFAHFSKSELFLYFNVRLSAFRKYISLSCTWNEEYFYHTFPSKTDKAIEKDNSGVHQKVRENKMPFKEFLLYMQDSMQPASAKLKKPSNQPPRFNLRKRKR